MMTKDGCCTRSTNGSFPKDRTLKVYHQIDDHAQDKSVYIDRIDYRHADRRDRDQYGLLCSAFLQWSIPSVPARFRIEWDLFPAKASHAIRLWAGLDDRRC